MANTRRDLLRTGSAALAAGALAASARARSASTLTVSELGRALAPGLPGEDYLPVRTPDGASLSWEVVDGVKVFHLVAEPVLHVFAPGLEAHCWGYNGRVHGPTIEAVEGERVRIYVTNRLGVATTIHWHGILLPNGMDGVGGLTQRTIEPGETFRYEFVLLQHGTFMYHSHHDEMTQMAMGLMGLFVIHPRHPESPPPERDYAYLLSEWKIDVGARRPNPNEMADFNVLTFNAKIAPATEPLLARRGERVRIRLGNLSAMSHHPIHLHGHSFLVTETDGGTIPADARWPEVTVIVPVGATRTIELVAKAPGDWALHCHMTHHVMTQMGHDVPNLIGVDPGRFDELLERAVPAYRTMGTESGGMQHDGMQRDDVQQEGMQHEGAQRTGAQGARPESFGVVPPNSLAMVGTRGPFGYVTMGGMFTVLKVREELDGTNDPGWYDHPEDELARPASEEELERDGIEP